MSGANKKCSCERRTNSIFVYARGMKLARNTQAGHMDLVEDNVKRYANQKAM